jgi:hypothetical protein
VALVAFGASVPPAWAHGGDESDEAGVLVRQAIALLVNTPGNKMAIEDKINDATDAKHSEGVDIALVTRAKSAFAQGDQHRARALLEVSIGARPHLSSALPKDIRVAPAKPGSVMAGVNLATGDQPGGGLADDPLVAKRHLDGRTTTMLILSLASIAFGAWLAIRYRPIRTSHLKTEAAS